MLQASNRERQSHRAQSLRLPGAHPIAPMFHGGRAQWSRGTPASMPHSDHSKEVCRPYGKNAASRVRQRYPLQKLSGASLAALQKALLKNEEKSYFSKLGTVFDNNKSPDSTSSNTFYHRGTNGIVCCLVSEFAFSAGGPRCVDRSQYDDAAWTW